MFKTTKMWMDTIALTHEMSGHVNRELLNDLIVKLQFIQQDEDAMAWEEGAPDVRIAWEGGASDV